METERVNGPLHQRDNLTFLSEGYFILDVFFLDFVIGNLTMIFEMGFLIIKINFKPDYVLSKEVEIS